MLVLITKEMELRGVQSQVSKKTNNAYYILNCEDIQTGEAHRFMCKDFNALPQGMKKGDIVELTLHYNRFKELEVYRVDKVGQ